MLLPGRFIPIAEDSGLVLPLGEWVLRTALREIGHLHRGEFPGLRVAVNLSARQFRQADLADLVHEVLAKTSFDPACLELELTESILMHHTEENIATLKAFKTMGVRIAIDDFGTGYSSLGYLQRFPVDVLKIDRSFVMDLPASGGNVAIVDAIIALAHGLGLEVVAEGVETPEQRTFLHAHGCDEGQGYHFGRPMPLTQFRSCWRGIGPGWRRRRAIRTVSCGGVRASPGKVCHVGSRGNRLFHRRLVAAGRPDAAGVRPGRGSHHPPAPAVRRRDGQSGGDDPGRGLPAAGLQHAALQFPGSRGQWRRVRRRDGEQDDVRAAAARLVGLGKTVTDLAGYSFGAWVNLRLNPPLATVRRQLLVAPPVVFLDFEPVATPPAELAVIVGDRDRMAPLDPLRALLPDWHPAARLYVVRGADHFFGTALDRLAARVEEALSPAAGR